VLRVCSCRIGGLGDLAGLVQKVKGAMLARLKLQLTSATDCVSGVLIG
jgi:hypothetical protein